jgi:hypothetical protein
MAAAPPVRVGVVLDLTSDTGRRSLTCISMALEDFYLKHPSYTTRMELRVRDSRGDIVTAAYAGKFDPVFVVLSQCKDEFYDDCRRRIFFLLFLHLYRLPFLSKTFTGIFSEISAKF